MKRARLETPPPEPADASLDSTVSAPVSDAGATEAQDEPSAGNQRDAGGGGPADATSTAGSCAGGRYTGPFAGSYASYLESLFGLGSAPLALSGTIDLTLTQDPSDAASPATEPGTPARSGDR